MSIMCLDNKGSYSLTVDFVWWNSNRKVVKANVWGGLDLSVNSNGREHHFRFRKYTVVI